MLFKFGPTKEWIKKIQGININLIYNQFISGSFQYCGSPFKCLTRGGVRIPKPIGDLHLITINANLEKHTLPAMKFTKLASFV